jgi:hypothetical protein
MPKRAYLIIGIVGVVCIFAGFSIGAESIPPAQLPTQALQKPTDTSIPGDGTFLVGSRRTTSDVRPGLYHSSRNSSRCVWRRSRDASFEKRSVIAEDTSRGESYVQLQSGEFFDTADCVTWHRVDGPLHS